MYELKVMKCKSKGYEKKKVVTLQELSHKFTRLKSEISMVYFAGDERLAHSVKSSCVRTSGQ